MQGRILAFGIVLMLFLLGCTESPVVIPDETSSEPPNPTRFDKEATGTITGKVIWHGDIPEVPLLYSSPSPLKPPPREPLRSWPNPFAPRVDATTRGMEDVVVALRGVDPQRARPWNHVPVHVEIKDCNLSVHQGKARSRFGFAYPGSTVTTVSRDSLLHVLQFRGSSFFAQGLPEPGVQRERRLRGKGPVELIGGGGRFWMRGYLFVDEHPYYARTDERGAFTLNDVSEGDYEIVVWIPDWRVAQVEHDAGSTQAAAVKFEPPKEFVGQVRVRRGQTVDRKIIVDASHFESNE